MMSVQITAPCVSTWSDPRSATAPETSASCYHELLQSMGQKLPGKAVLALDDLFRRALRHDHAAAVTAFRAQVDDPVGALDHVQVVLDDTTVFPCRPAAAARSAATDVVEVQAGGRFVQQIERLARIGAAQLVRQLDALRLAAGERGRRLAQDRVAQTDLLHRGQAAMMWAKFSKESAASSMLIANTSAIDFAAIDGLQRLAVETAPRHLSQVTIQVRQEAHLDLLHAVP